MLARAEHFMPATLVASQFETLEDPEEGLRIDAEGPLEAVAERAAVA